MEEELKAALRFNMRACEMSAGLLRDRRRTKAYGEVAKMVERIACQFDRLASRAREAIAKAEGK